MLSWLAWGKLIVNQYQYLGPYVELQTWAVFFVFKTPKTLQIRKIRRFASSGSNGQLIKGSEVIITNN